MSETAIAASSNKPSKAGIKPGTIVGAQRWPQPLHSGLPPWKGVVLAIDDPLAWRGSIAFGDDPLPEHIADHIRFCQARGLLQNTVPVLWDFRSRTAVYWELLVPVGPERYHEDDLALWRIYRQAFMPRPRAELVAA